MNRLFGFKNLTDSLKFYKSACRAYSRAYQFGKYSVAESMQRLPHGRAILKSAQKDDIFRFELGVPLSVQSTLNRYEEFKREVLLKPGQTKYTKVQWPDGTIQPIDEEALSTFRTQAAAAAAKRPMAPPEYYHVNSLTFKNPKDGCDYIQKVLKDLTGTFVAVRGIIAGDPDTQKELAQGVESSIQPDGAILLRPYQVYSTVIKNLQNKYKEYLSELGKDLQRRGLAPQTPLAILWISADETYKTLQAHGQTNDEPITIGGEVFQSAEEALDYAKKKRDLYGNKIKDANGITNCSIPIATSYYIKFPNDSGRPQDPLAYVVDVSREKENWKHTRANFIKIVSPEVHPTPDKIYLQIGNTFKGIITDSVRKDLDSYLGQVVDTEFYQMPLPTASLQDRIAEVNKAIEALWAHEGSQERTTVYYVKKFKYSGYKTKDGESSNVANIPEDTIIENTKGVRLALQAELDHLIEVKAAKIEEDTKKGTHTLKLTIPEMWPAEQKMQGYRDAVKLLHPDNLTYQHVTHVRLNEGKPLEKEEMVDYLSTMIASKRNRNEEFLHEINLGLERGEFTLPEEVTIEREDGKRVLPEGMTRRRAASDFSATRNVPLPPNATPEERYNYLAVQDSVSYPLANVYRSSTAFILYRHLLDLMDSKELVMHSAEDKKEVPVAREKNLNGMLTFTQAMIGSKDEPVDTVINGIVQVILTNLDRIKNDLLFVKNSISDNVGINVLYVTLNEFTSSDTVIVNSDKFNSLKEKLYKWLKDPLIRKILYLICIFRISPRFIKDTENFTASYIKGLFGKGGSSLAPAAAATGDSETIDAAAQKRIEVERKQRRQNILWPAYFALFKQVASAKGVTNLEVIEAEAREKFDNLSDYKAEEIFREYNYTQALSIPGRSMEDLLPTTDLEDTGVDKAYAEDLAMYAQEGSDEITLRAFHSPSGIHSPLYSDLWQLKNAAVYYSKIVQFLETLKSRGIKRYRFSTQKYRSTLSVDTTQDPRGSGHYEDVPDGGPRITEWKEIDTPDTSGSSLPDEEVQLIPGSINYYKAKRDTAILDFDTALRQHKREQEILEAQEAERVLNSDEDIERLEATEVEETLQFFSTGMRFHHLSDTGYKFPNINEDVAANLATSVSTCNLDMYGPYEEMQLLSALTYLDKKGMSDTNEDTEEGEEDGDYYEDEYEDYIDSVGEGILLELVSTLKSESGLVLPKTLRALKLKRATGIDIATFGLCNNGHDEELRKIYGLYGCLGLGILTEEQESDLKFRIISAFNTAYSYAKKEWSKDRESFEEPSKPEFVEVNLGKDIQRKNVPVESVLSDSIANTFRDSLTKLVMDKLRGKIPKTNAVEPRGNKSLRRIFLGVN